MITILWCIAIFKILLLYLRCMICHSIYISYSLFTELENQWFGFWHATYLCIKSKCLCFFFWERMMRKRIRASKLNKKNFMLVCKYFQYYFYFYKVENWCKTTVNRSIFHTHPKRNYENNIKQVNLYFFKVKIVQYVFYEIVCICLQSFSFCCSFLFFCKCQSNVISSKIVNISISYPQTVVATMKICQKTTWKLFIRISVILVNIIEMLYPSLVNLIFE